MNRREPNPFIVKILQLGFLAFLWVTGLGIIIWILGLIRLSLQLKDIPSASIGISLVAIPVFLLLLSLATYVFWGILFDTSQDKQPAPPGKEKHHEN